MKIETKFNIGDNVLINGERYTVSAIYIKVTDSGEQEIRVHGRKVYGEDENGRYTIGDCALEKDVVADPLAKN